MKKAALIVSTGSQDLKIVCQKKSDGSIVALKPKGNRNFSIRWLHEQWLSGKIPTRIVDDEEQIRSECSNLSQSTPFKLTADDRASIRLSETPGRVFDDQDFEPLVNNEGAYLLFPAKLHSVVSGLKKQGYEIAAALVCYTDRKYHPNSDFERDYQNEPVATGPLIARWLAAGHGANPQEGADFENHPFCHLNYLKDEVALEGERVALNKQFSPYDQPLALSAIARTDQAISELAKVHPDCTAVVSHTGGPGDMKAPLTASARLHFGGRIIEIHDNKYARFQPENLSSEAFRVPPRNAALETRHQAALRLWEGDFAGAWAVASFIARNDPCFPCDPWVEKVRQAANFMQGWRAHDRAIIHPFKEVPAGIQKLVLLAWRVEAALQHDHGEPLITDALRQLATLREKALEYFVLTALVRDPKFEGSVCLSSWRVQFPPPKPPAKKPKYKKLEPSDGYLDTRSIKKLESYLKTADPNSAYCPFKKKIEAECSGPGSMNLRKLRNELTHNTLSDSQVEAIRACAQERDLWRYQPNQQNIDNLGHCFLTRPVVTALFQALAPNLDLAAGYRRFVGELIEAVKTPLSVDCRG